MIGLNVISANYARNFVKPVSIVFLTGQILFFLGIVTEEHIAVSVRRSCMLGICSLFVITLAILYMWNHIWRCAEGIFRECTKYIDDIPNKHVPCMIILASALSLYMEFLIIRWHSSCFGVFAHFKNISLISCFLGLGIGFSRGRSNQLTFPVFLPLLALQIIGMFLLQSTALQYILGNPISEQSAHGLANATVPGNLILYGFLIFIFTFNVINFVPLGELVSRLMLKSSNLKAYGLNLIGSIIGICAFTVLSFAWCPPSIWILIGSLGALPFLFENRMTFFISFLFIATALIALTTVKDKGVSHTYSPYQIVSIFTQEGKVPRLLVNHAYHQRIFDLSKDSQINNSSLKIIAQYYDFPYSLKHEPDEVLIVGSGTGNDVAAALRNGSSHVDAVEIDPLILYYGKQLHPEQPYESDKTTAIVDDARSYFRKTNKKYDVIVYGLLDSHTLQSGMSNIRLDSFVYTIEAFREARNRLKNDGLLFMSFSIFSEIHGRKLFLMLQEAFEGESPRVFRTLYDYAFTYVIGPGSKYFPDDPGIQFEEYTDKFNNPDIIADMSTDDWPFFYMSVRAYPKSYVIMIIIFAIISLLTIIQTVPGSREGFSIPCFFLGAGFMLVETKGITELGLAFGNTWVVISVVVCGILFMSFLANCTVIAFKRISNIFVYSLIGVSLVVGYFINISDFPSDSLWSGNLLWIFLLVVPIYFAGLAFSTEIAKGNKIHIALASNLLGAIFGGFLEYNSMYFGFKALYLIAMVMYFLAFVFGRKAS